MQSISKRKATFFLWITICFAACQNSNNKSSTMPPGGPTAVTDYPVLALKPRDVTTSIKIPASIQGQQVVEIRPKVDGFIEAIYVSEGATVKKGQPLFKISNPQYDQELRTAQAGIKSAEANVNAARESVEKVRPLVEQDIVSKYQLTSAQYTLQAQEAALAQAKATLVNAQANVGYTNIRSPQNGVIGTIPYKIGALVSSTSTDALTTMSNSGSVFAYISMDEKQLLQFREKFKGTTMQDKLNHLPAVTLTLADGSTYPEKGKLEAASGIIDTETGSISLKAAFANHDGLLSSGASGMVVIPVTTADAIVIPQSATFEMQDKRLIYRVEADNKVNSVAIKTSATDDGKYFIVSSGLKAGDRIVISGITGLKDGTEIKPAAKSADSVYSALSH